MIKGSSASLVYKFEEDSLSFLMAGGSFRICQYGKRVHRMNGDCKL